MSNLKMQEEYLESRMTSLGNGPRKEKLNLLELEKELTEDIKLKIFFPIRKEEKSAMHESLPLDKKRIWKNKLSTSNNTTQTMKSLKTLEAVLISRGRDLKPFWNQQSEEISRRLWLPTETDCVDLDSNSLNGSLPTLKGKSWFSMTTVPRPKKSSLKTSYQSSLFSLPEFTDSENIKNKSKLKTIRIKITPNQEQKNNLDFLFETFRWYYNCSLDILNKDDNIKNSTVKKDISNIKLRDIIRKYKYTEEKAGNLLFMDFIRDEDNNAFPCPSYWKNIHNRIPRGAIKSLVGNVNSALSNKRNGNIHSFHLNYKTKKDKKYTVLFEDERYPSWLNDIPGVYRYGRKIFSLKDILKVITVKNLILNLDRERGKYYIYLPVESDWCPVVVENQDKNSMPKNSYISLDTGIRTFQTGYSDNHTVQIGSESDILARILQKIDSLQERLSIETNNKKRKRLRKRKIRLYYRLKCLVDDIHWKTAHFLVSGYKNIILPDFRISGMVKKTLPKKVKRLLYVYSFFRFKERLSYKCNSHGSNLHIVDESYTSKTCGRCGSLNDSLGSKKVFLCPKCNLKIDRDINGARNILIKNWPTLQGH